LRFKPVETGALGGRMLGEGLGDSLIPFSLPFGSGRVQGLFDFRHGWHRGPRCDLDIEQRNGADDAQPFVIRPQNANRQCQLAVFFEPRRRQ
jgi:hypothetical protein